MGDTDDIHANMTGSDITPQFVRTIAQAEDDPNVIQDARFVKGDKTMTKGILVRGIYHAPTDLTWDHIQHLGGFFKMRWSILKVKYMSELDMAASPIEASPVYGPHQDQVGDLLRLVKRYRFSYLTSMDIDNDEKQKAQRIQKQFSVVASGVVKMALNVKT